MVQATEGTKANEGLRQILLKNERFIQLAKEVVASYYQREVDEFEQRTRKREIVKMRQVTAYVVRTLLPKISLQSMGKIIGDKDHATILYSIRKISGHMSIYPVFKKEVEEIINILSAMTEKTEWFWDNLKKDHFYVNLSRVKVLRLSNDAAVVFTGVTEETIKNIRDQFFSNETEITELNNTGLYILEKIHKNENNGDNTEGV
jgi:hypothetical protein